MNPHNAPKKVEWGCTAITFVSLIFIFVVGVSLFPAYATGNTLLILLAAVVPGLLIGLLQIKFIHDWFINNFIPFLNRLDPHILNVLRSFLRIVHNHWNREIIFGLIILVLIINNYIPIPGTLHSWYANSLCIQNQTPGPFCGNGIYVTPMQVNESKNNPNTVSNMNIGIIDSASGGPFNQYDTHNYDVEYNLEKDIFNENQSCARPSYVTLVVVTALSQTAADTSLSSNVGLDELRGAYMAQYNFNHDQSQHPCLRLLIANFGTKEVASQTVPTLMQQIKLYASSDPQHFIGAVGFPFSKSVTPALYARVGIPDNDIPIVSSSASATSFVNPPNATPPDNFYTNFYRVVPSVSVLSTVLADFLPKHLGSIQPPTLLFEDDKDPYSRDLGSQIFKNLGANNTAYYTEGEPNTLDTGIKNILQGHYTQIFFSGFADDLNALRNKLYLSKANGKLTGNIRIIGGEGLYDLGSYTDSNYANLFFTVNASYAQINLEAQPISLNGISGNQNCPSQNISPFDSNFNYEFCQFFNQGNPSSIYGYRLPGSHVLQMYDAVETFLQALPPGNNQTNSPLWQTINQNLPTVHFQGVTGKIQFSQSASNSINEPINKPIYIACTDSQSYTHAVGKYTITGPSFSYTPVEGGLTACKPPE